MAQQLAVGLIVALAALYAAWHFMPARWRRALAGRLGVARRGAASGGCHTCDDCAGCRAPAISGQNRTEPAPILREQLFKK